MGRRYRIKDRAAANRWGPAKAVAEHLRQLATKIEQSPKMIRCDITLHTMDETEWQEELVALDRREKRKKRG